MKGRCSSSPGFTLIETIITIVIAAILGVFVYQYMGSSLMRSSDPFFRLQKSFSLQDVAENMTADYKKNFTADLPGLKAKIGVANASMDNDYGKYIVVYNNYITFNADNAETETTEQKMLKVIIANEQNETLTLLFISA